MSGELLVPADFAVPDPPQGHGPGGNAESVQGADVRSWVRADRAQLDRVVYGAVLAWLERDWPFTSFEYAPRA